MDFDIGLFMGSLGRAFNGFMIDIIIWLLIIGTASFFAWKTYNTHMIYKYVFILVDSKGNLSKKKARIIKNTKGIRKFKLKDYDDPMYYLSVKEHNGTWNGKVARFIAWDGMGNLAYTDGFSLDKQLYLETALTEIERTEAVDAQMESAEKSNMMNKAMKWGAGLMVLIIVMVCVTLLGVAKFGFENSNTFSQAMTQANSASENYLTSIKVIEGNTKAMENLIGTLINENNLTINQVITAK